MVRETADPSAALPMYKTLTTTESIAALEGVLFIGLITPRQRAGSTARDDKKKRVIVAARTDRFL
jgi:hypothetical protein